MDKKMNSKQARRRKKKISRNIGISLSAFQLLITIIFIALLFVLNILPEKYIIMLTIVLGLLSAYTFLSQLSNAHKIGKVLAVIMIITLGTGSFYIAKTTGALSAITGAKTKTDAISVIVLKDDPATTINAAANYTFGHHTILDLVNTNKAINDINKELSTNIKVHTASDWNTLINNLYSGSIQAIIINESYRNTFNETYEGFNDKTRVLTTFHYTSDVEISNKDIEVTDQTFTVYIAGNDAYGSLSQTGKNDVNIIATINPKTKQVLLVNTPRDYYITIFSPDGASGLDKLTHAGNFGVDYSIKALNTLYDIDIDYYVRVNFTGVVDIIDSLGGVTINSDVDFTTTADTSPVKYHYTIGENECDGEKALAFCRERIAFDNGDNQRGENQMKLIEAVVDKITSLKMLSSYTSVLDSISGCFETSIEQNKITDLVKMTLNSPSSWTIQTYAVEGTSYESKVKSTFWNFTMYAMKPTESTIGTAKTLMNKIKNNETFDVEQFVSSTKEHSATVK